MVNLRNNKGFEPPKEIQIFEINIALEKNQTLETIRKKDEFLNFLSELPQYITKKELEALYLITRDANKEATKKLYSQTDVYNFLISYLPKTYEEKEPPKYLNQRDKKEYISKTKQTKDKCGRPKSIEKIGLIGKLIKAGLIGQTQTSNPAKKRTWKNQEIYTPKIFENFEFQYIAQKEYPTLNISKNEIIINKWSSDDLLFALEEHLGYRKHDNTKEIKSEFNKNIKERLTDKNLTFDELNEIIQEVKEKLSLEMSINGFGSLSGFISFFSSGIFTPKTIQINIKELNKNIQEIKDKIGR